MSKQTITKQSVSKDTANKKKAIAKELNHTNDLNSPTTIDDSPIYYPQHYIYNLKLLIDTGVANDNQISHYNEITKN